MRIKEISLAAVAAGGLLSGCSSASNSDSITVLAASSLTDVFGSLEDDFERDEAGVETSFGGSPALAQQVVEGAPADVLATASPDTMRTVVEAGAVDGKPQVFARNIPVIVVPRGNPAGIKDLKDLTKDGPKVALCAKEVPCGAVSHATAEAAGLKLAPDTEESNVRSVLSKVAAGEVDAGIVYRTDVTDEVDSIKIPEPESTAYQIAAIEGAGSRAKDWIELVRGEDGQKALRDAGFIVD